MKADSNTVDVFWTLGGVLAWVMFRDLKYAQEFSEEGKLAAVLGVLGALPRMHGEEKTRPIMSFARAQSEVLIELQKGDFKSTGMRHQSPIREDIPALEWVNRVAGAIKGGESGLQPKVRQNSGTGRSEREGGCGMKYCNRLMLKKKSWRAREDSNL
jgi:hypothetical protein